MSLTPALIHNFWIGLPPETNQVDAVYERRDGYIVFFVGKRIKEKSEQSHIIICFYF